MRGNVLHVMVLLNIRAIKPANISCKYYQSPLRFIKLNEEQDVGI